MKSLKIYNMLTEDGQTLDDMILQVPMDYSWEMIFSMVLEKTGVDVDSYSYEEIN